MKLSELKNGETAVIVRLSGHGGFRKRIMEMGFIRGEKVKSVLDSPMHDPVKYNVMGYDVMLRRNEAAMIEVLPEDEAKKELTPAPTFSTFSICEECNGESCSSCILKKIKTKRNNVINVALIGNPNSGKTSIFNALSNQNEHVGNYSGVTVDAKTGSFNYKNYRINITDLPGTYSIAAYSPEEIYVRRHLFEQMPDIIINTVVASNLERNLYLTTELIDMNLRTVVALNMYDELLASGAVIDYDHLGGMIGIPVIPTVAKNGKGLNKLLDTVIELFEGENKTIRHIHINYGNIIEEQIAPLSAAMHKADDLPQQFPVRYWALKLLEGDSEAANFLSKSMELPRWQHLAENGARRVQAQMGVDVETAINGAKYGFVNGALQETFKPGNKDAQRQTKRIDRLVANRWLGFPIFILAMWAMFSSVFMLGAYPQEWIENLFGLLGDIATAFIPAGALQDLVVNGIISGVGSVAVFIPQILILYLFISFMEDSGYMARAAFIMDRLMHKMGLHGKSFIPMVMGFGCNVPAIMASRMIEDRKCRLITILVNPLMSCSARLPIYLVLIGAFYPKSGSVILLSIYTIGILLAVLMARLFSKFLVKGDNTPFVMELPPYRIPTTKTILRHTWEKGAQYLKKMGGVIMIASIIIWFLGYYPNHNAYESVTEQQEHSYIGQIGKAIEPVIEPLGFDWKLGIGLVSGVGAKELVVSTLGVLYTNEEDIESVNLSDRIPITPVVALGYMLFVLIYFPCVATLAAIKQESGSWKWALFAAFYTTALAWLVAFAINSIGKLF